MAQLMQLLVTALTLKMAILGAVNITDDQRTDFLMKADYIIGYADTQIATLNSTPVVDTPPTQLPSSPVVASAATLLAAPVTQPAALIVSGPVVTEKVWRDNSQAFLTAHVTIETSVPSTVTLYFSKNKNLQPFAASQYQSVDKTVHDFETPPSGQSSYDYRLVIQSANQTITKEGRLVGCSETPMEPSFSTCSAQ